MVRVHNNIMYLMHRPTTIYIRSYMEIFEGLVCMYFTERKSERILWFIFANHQVECIVSLSHCFFLRIKILCLTSLQQNS